MIAIGVTTAPRGRNYLNNTVQQLKYEFPGTDIFIFAEPDTPKTVGGVWTFNPTKLGQGYNLLNGLQSLRDEADWIMMCEDDISLCPGFGDKITNILNRIGSKYKVGFLSPYCSYVNADPGAQGWSLAKRSMYGWCGMLCTIWPKESIPDEPLVVKKDWGPDASIGDLVLALGKHIYTHVPSLVTHIGDISTGQVRDTDMRRQAYDGFYHPPFYDLR